MTQRKKPSSYYRKRRRKRQKMLRLLAIILIIVAIIVVAVVIIVNVVGKKSDSSKEINSDTTGETYMESTTASSEDINPKTGYIAGPPSPSVASTATVGATGDILLHNSVLNGALQSDGTYDFSESFSDIAPYWSALDYMIVNLEVPCGGDDDPTGYPTFDAPDSIVTDLKEAGVDMCLTATNHAYDCGTTGLLHTQEVLNSEGLDHVGTRTDESQSYVLVKEINGITFGFSCYTYDTREDPSDQKSLNGITMNDDAVNLVNSFCYSDLDSLYTSISSDLQTMENAGCDVTVFFMHWGTEYTDDPVDVQTEIAQNMSDLGVDVIIGGHPHVIQKYDTLTGKNGNTTYCLYSMGNAISSQRASIMDEDANRGYTEDGLVFEFTYEKLNNGKVKLTDIYILPTWVEVGSNGVYYIDPLDQSLPTSSWPCGSLGEAIASYNRTEGRVGESYPLIRAQLGQAAVASSIE